MEFEIHDREKSQEADEILRNLREYNAGFFPGAGTRELTISIKDKDKVVAGLTGSSSWGWLFVRLLWVSDDLRGKGLGKQLMDRAEVEARRRGCHGVWLDTFSFQARDFYIKLGYQIFGKIEEFPRQHTRYFLMKRI